MSVARYGESILKPCICDQVQHQEGVQDPGSTVGSLLDDILRGDSEGNPTATGSQPGLNDTSIALRRSALTHPIWATEVARMQ